MIKFNGASNKRQIELSGLPSWQTAVLNYAKVGRMGIWCGRVFQCIIVHGKNVNLQQSFRVVICLRVQDLSGHHTTHSTAGPRLIVMP